MEALAALFAASFVAATLLPMPSEVALFAYLQAYPERLGAGVIVATIGNTLGGMTSYCLGRFFPKKPINEKAEKWIRRFGAPVAFFAWLPLLGDALSVAAGWLRVPWWAVLVFMALGRLTRYLVVAFLSVG